MFFDDFDLKFFRFVQIGFYSMKKDSGMYVFSQIVDFLKMSQFNKFVRSTNETKEHMI